MAINNVKRKKNYLNKQSGGVNIFGLGGMTGAIRKTKRSELTLINAYEEYENKTRKYNTAFKEHLDNLKKLDDYGNFKGLETLFTKIIIPDEFKGDKIDKSNPLLFRNYLVNAEIPPSEFRKEHIKQQIRYILNESFAERDRMLIRYFDVELGKTEFIMNVITIDNIKKSRKISHDNYIISMSETKSNLKDILNITKKNLKRKSLVVEIDNKHSLSSYKKNSTKSSKSRSNKSKLNTIKSKDNTFKLKFNTTKKKNTATLKLPSQNKKNTVIFTPFMTADMKKQMADKEAKEKAEEQAKLEAEKRAQIEAQKKFAPITPSPNIPMIDLGAKKEGLLEGEQIAQPLGTDLAEEQKCMVHTTFADCKNAGCFFDNNTNKCITFTERKRNFQPQAYKPPSPAYIPPSPANPFQ